jgi:TRAP-type C4-dicarboxylate transport system substrate-binding protein
MKKNKLLGIAIAAMVSISSIVPAFATDTVLPDTTTSTITSDAKQANSAEKLAKLTERATKLGIDITGLTNEQARDKIRAAEALKLGVDITGLSKEEANAKFQIARAIKLGVAITGLSEEVANANMQPDLQETK